MKEKSCSILEVNNVYKDYISKSYTTNVLRGITFNLKKGEFVGIMGPSGSGKTTLLNIISTIDTFSKGSILINGREINNISENEKSDFRRENLGFIFQEYNLIDTLTLKENIELTLSINNYNTCKIENKVLKIANFLGIKSILNKYPYEVSGGEKQRCACARALILNPSMILADEPTGALDSNSSKKFLEIINEISIDSKITILMVTHDPIVASYASRVLFIKDGLLYKDIKNHSLDRIKFHKEISSIMERLGDDIYENDV